MGKVASVTGSAIKPTLPGWAGAAQGGVWPAGSAGTGGITLCFAEQPHHTVAWHHRRCGLWQAPCGRRARACWRCWRWRRCTARPRRPRRPRMRRRWATAGGAGAPPSSAATSASCPTSPTAGRHRSTASATSATAAAATISRRVRAPGQSYGAAWTNAVHCLLAECLWLISVQQHVRSPHGEVALDSTRSGSRMRSRQANEPLLMRLLQKLALVLRPGVPRPRRMAART